MFASLAYAVALAPRSAQVVDARVTVDVRRSIGRVNRWVFGGNHISYQVGGYGDTSPNGTDRGMGVWDPLRRRSTPEMVALEKRAGLVVARWPGGCATHLYDWKKSIGPIAARLRQQFGLPEFLQHCRDVGATPIITVQEYRGTAQDAADLVEYLNAPDNGLNAWAARRTQDGRTEPWGVVWFEYGNESEHGPHRSNDDFGRVPPMTANEYARRYLDYRRAMRAVDPRVRLGAVVSTGFPDLDGWPRSVCRAIGPSMDFAIHHSYKVAYDRNDPAMDVSELFRAALACADQIQDYYDRMRTMMREATGRDDIPIAVTEYNGAFVQEVPTPFRHCLGNALVNAEMLRVFLRPRNRIVMANFWQFANEYWGAVKGYAAMGDRVTLRPQYWPFALYHEHFGEQLVAAEVACPTYDTEGGFGVAPARGAGSAFRLWKDVRSPDGSWKLTEAAGVLQSEEGGVLSVDFADAGDVNYYHARKVLPAAPNTWYRLSGLVRTEGLTSANGASFQFGDARGWIVTKSCAITPSVTGTKGWTEVFADYRTLPDTKEVEIVARRLGGEGAVRGRAWYRDVRVQRVTPASFPGPKLLGVDTSRSRDGRRTYLMIVNRSLDSHVRTAIRVRGLSPSRARAWTLKGPSVDATNETKPDNVHVAEQDLGRVSQGFTIVLAPHSLTAIEVIAAGTADAKGTRK